MSLYLTEKTESDNIVIVPKHFAIPPKDNKIYWHIDESQLPENVDKYQVIFAMEQAFKLWQPMLTPIILEATGDRKIAPIILKFRRNGDPDFPSTFSSRTLALAYYPRGSSLGIHADVYFNLDKKWEVLTKPGFYSLKKVAVHELGHSLGLNHSQDRQDIMYPYIYPNDRIIITEDTKKGIHDLYDRFKMPEIPPEIPDKPEKPDKCPDYALPQHQTDAMWKILDMHRVFSIEVTKHSGELRDLNKLMYQYRMAFDTLYKKIIQETGNIERKRQ